MAAQHSGIHPRPQPQDSLFHLYLGFISENTLALFTAVEIKKTSFGGISFSLTLLDHWNKQRTIKEAIQWSNGSQVRFFTSSVSLDSSVNFEESLFLHS